MVASKNFSIEEVIECGQLAQKRSYDGPIGVSCVQWGKRRRAVYNKVFTRPITETSAEFIIWHLRYVLGDKWFNMYRQLPPDNQHIVMQWGLRMGAERKRVLSSIPEPVQVVGMAPSGDVQALLTLADDVYRLCLVGQLPEGILESPPRLA